MKGRGKFLPSQHGEKWCEQKNGGSWGKSIVTRWSPANSRTCFWTSLRHITQAPYPSTLHSSAGWVILPGLAASPCFQLFRPRLLPPSCSLAESWPTRSKSILLAPPIQVEFFEGPIQLGIPQLEKNSVLSVCLFLLSGFTITCFEGFHRFWLLFSLLHPRRHAPSFIQEAGLQAPQPWPVDSGIRVFASARKGSI